MSPAGVRGPLGVHSPLDEDGADRWRERAGSGDWGAIAAEVDEFGGALLPRLLSGAETAAIRSM